jgi:hypothetical protein
MSVQSDRSTKVEHEHWFVDHEDPRWLICDCGQYAVRARNIAGDRIVRLIDPPKPVFPQPLTVSLTTTDLTDACPTKAAADLARPA